jgi:hypothetical protein
VRLDTSRRLGIVADYFEKVFIESWGGLVDNREDAEASFEADNVLIQQL